MNKEQLKQLISEGLASTNELIKSKIGGSQEYLSLLPEQQRDLILHGIELATSPFKYDPKYHQEWEVKYNGKYIDTVNFTDADTGSSVLFRKPRNNSLIIDVNNIIVSNDCEANGVNLTREDGTTFQNVLLKSPSRVEVVRGASKYGEYSIA